MNRIGRILTTGAVGIVAGLTAGAGAAQASVSTGHSGSAVVSWGDGGSEIVGFYGTRSRCEWVGDRGEFHDAWDDHDCFRIRYGLHRGDWALKVYDDDDNGWDHGGFWPGYPLV